MEFLHKSVLLNETITSLDIKPNGVYVDATLGGGGHSQSILEKLEHGLLIGIDQDEDALNFATQRLSQYKSKLKTVKGNFENLGEILDSLGIDRVDGILADFGVSSYQLDNPDRGFSYHNEARLDMRMDKNASLDAIFVINNYSEDKLSQIIRDFGEEKHHKRIARAICENRPIFTTTQLSEIVKNAIPARDRRTGSHPSKKTFQAIRIEVNDELGVIERFLDVAVSRLKSGGRLCVITFHSLEDRIAKQKFKSLVDVCKCPAEFPKCICGAEPIVKQITRKPIVASPEELNSNNRSRSAKLRVIEKV